MVIKWKSKIILLSWLFLLTFGISGIGLGISSSSVYLRGDYFQTEQFQSQLNQFIDYLSVFELNYIDKAEAKKALTVTDDEIKEHRYRYGDLPEQNANIRGQYELKIREALESNNKQLADFYTAERDKKIEDITNNFRSDEYVRVKVIKEKEEKIDDYYHKLENHWDDFSSYQGIFMYYLKDTITGAVYSNMEAATSNEIDELINSSDMMFIQSYPSQGGKLLTTGRPDLIAQEGLPITKSRQFEGKIAVPKSAPVLSSVHENYLDFKERQQLFYLYTLIGLLTFIISLVLYRKTAIKEALDMDQGQPYYNRIPLDLRFVGLAITGLLLAAILTNTPPLYLHGYLYSFLKETLSNLVIATFLVALVLIQGKYLSANFKDLAVIHAAWQKSLSCKAYKGIQEAFLIRSIGTQMLILLALVFAFGVGITMVALKPQLIVLYVSFLIILGIPTLLLIIKRTGYLNRIIAHTGELARGNFDADLPVTGRSVLAELAKNINTLKQGVKASQKLQAKSERLKTELITNVSHDLRTPLTSIITYTELLKTSDLAEEERQAYLQIIDRKSKRLKILIDDLFEVSKMATGNVELVKAKVDLVQLLQQALAEHDEAITESTLQFRIRKSEKPVLAIVDGQKLWRVFDNLIGNILKYALENTRVYISVQAVDGKAVIVFKNITKYELGESIEELFERFKRGDTSRHTEGSGLGLAIAKSIIDLHGGNLDIELDGDLFKVTISLNPCIA